MFDDQDKRRQHSYLTSSSSGDVGAGGCGGQTTLTKTSSPPSSGLRILMKDLSYHVASNKQRGQRAYLLRGVSAFLEPGLMTALMGPSGSGKTTLLDLLAGRTTIGKVEGHLSFGGVQPTKQFLRRYAGYVEQFGTLLGDLTVREMLLYTAELKRPMHEPLADKRREVDKLLRRLALEYCADVKIGDPMAKGISGGQAKRTNIGIALISNPRVLFLDEPTSGLDSYTAHEVMKVVSGLVADGTTIAATIHSPTAAIFALFDRVMLLVRGQLVYFGPQGLPALQFAAAEWPSATVASQLLALHRAADAVNAAASGGVAQQQKKPQQGAGGGGDGGVFLAAAAAAEHVQPISALAFNNAEVLVETVTEADLGGRAEELVDVYKNSDLRKENNRQLELYLAAETVRSIRPPPSSTCKRKDETGQQVTAVSLLGSGKSDGVISKRDEEFGTAIQNLPGAVDTPGDVSPVRARAPAVTTTTTTAASTTAAGSALAIVTVPDGDDAQRHSVSVSEKVAQELATRSETVIPWYWGVLILLKYRTGHNIRSLAWLGPRIADKLLASFVILTLYMGVGDELEAKNIMNITAALFMWSLLPAFGAASYVPALVLERRLFVRERSDGLYRAFTYLAAKLVEELLLALVITLAFSAYVFYGLQLRGDWVVFCLVYFVDLSVGIVLAYLIAAMSPNMDVANAAFPGFVVTLLFFAGQLMTLEAMPVWWKWYSRIDFLRYAWGALMVNQFEDNDPEFAGGLTVLQYYGLQGADKWAYLGYLSLFWLVFAVLALLALTYMRHQKR